MRILALSNSPLDPGSGSGYVICGYAERLRARGHEVELLGPADFEPFFGWRRAIRHRQAIGMAAACLDRLGGAGVSGGIDLVELWGAEGWLAATLLAATGPHRFAVVSRSNGLETHASEVLAAAGLGDPPRFWRPDPARLSERAFRRADALVTVSAWDAAWARARGLQPERRLLAIDNPLPESYLGRPLELARGPEIGFCGSWLPRKGIAAIARELPAVLRGHSDWRLTLVGVGEGFAAESEFPADVLSRITIVPVAERERELGELYRRFAILIVPSIYESFGLVVAEAMACGAAVAATPVGFAAALSPDEEVVHVGAAPGALGAAVERLIGDEALRRRVAEGGWRRVQSLRWAAAVDRLEVAYRRLVEDVCRGR